MDLLAKFILHNYYMDSVKFNILRPQSECLLAYDKTFKVWKITKHHHLFLALSQSF
jgi:hypothetical protein